MAARRRQSLAQMAIAWLLAKPGMTSVIVGASSVGQLDNNIAAVDNIEFTIEELAEIDAILNQ